MPKGLSGYRNHLQYYSPKKSWNQILEILNHKKTDIGGKQKEVELLFSQFAKHEMAHSAFRLLRILSTEFVKAQKLIHTVNKVIKFSHMYGFTPNDPNKLRVYVNMDINNTSEFDLFTDACPYHRHGALETLITRVNSDMENPNAAKGWVPLSRGRARLKRYEDMPIERALMRYSDAKSHYPEALIKEIAGQIEELRLPLELHYAETPEQILYMYSSGPSSCMFVGGKERPWRWMTDIGRHPCDFFAFHPFIRGVYTKVKSKGTVTARTYLYTMPDGKECHGRIYGADGRAGTALQNALSETGVKPIPVNGETDRGGSAGTFARECTFRIPGVPNDGEIYLPVPYMDNLRGGVNFAYDKEKKEFIVNCYDGSGYYMKDGKKLPYKEYSGYAGMTSGYLSSNHIGAGVECTHCGTRINSSSNIGRLAERVTGFRYCSNACIQAAGRVIARLGNSTQVIAIKSEVYIDPIADMYYTTEEACREAGGRPYEYDPLVADEEVRLSVGGYVIGSPGQEIRYPDGVAADVNQRYSRFNRINTSRIKETKHKYLEIDFSRVEGVRFIGTIPEQYSAETIDNDFGYPTNGSRTRMYTVMRDAENAPYISGNNQHTVRLRAGSTNIRQDEEVPVAA